MLYFVAISCLQVLFVDVLLDQHVEFASLLHPVFL